MDYNKLLCRDLGISPRPEYTSPSPDQPQTRINQYTVTGEDDSPRAIVLGVRLGKLITRSLPVEPLKGSRIQQFYEALEEILNSSEGLVYDPRKDELNPEQNYDKVHVLREGATFVAVRKRNIFAYDVLYNPSTDNESSRIEQAIEALLRPTDMTRILTKFK